MTAKEQTKPCTIRRRNGRRAQEAAVQERGKPEWRPHEGHVSILTADPNLLKQGGGVGAGRAVRGPLQR